VKTDSIDNWENAMKQLILNSGLKNLLGQNGRKKVQSEFDSKKVCKEMESFYFRILEEKRT
jgi:glycosyltransferase involved in cell wall biosynthesis